MEINDRRLDALTRRIERLTESTTITEEQPDFTKYRDDPTGFARDILGLESATRRSTGEQYNYTFLEGIASSRRTVIVAARRCSKTTTISAAAIWFLLTRPMCRVLLVAPTAARHLSSILLAEIATQIRHAKVRLPVDVLTDRVYVKGYGATWSIVGVSSVDPALAEGFHSRYGLLCVCDEAKSLPESLIDSLQGSMAGPDAHLVLASTPGAPTGALYKAWSDDTGFWTKFHISGEDSSLVDPLYIADRRQAWGVASPLYRAHVCGEFTAEGNNSLFPLSIIERAIACELPTDPDSKLRLGVDVARSVSGDQNCVCVVRGGKVERFALWRSPDTMATVNRVIAEATTASPKHIYVDVGGVGGGVCDRLTQLRARRLRKQRAQTGVEGLEDVVV